MSLPEEGRGPVAAPAREILRHLRWPLRQRLGVHTAGDARSQLRGPGVEYADVREYQQGEDARLIDWNLTARSDRPYVRESNPDRGLDVWLLVDASRSLDWGTARCLKREAAAEVADLLTTLLARHGTRVGSIVFGAAVRRTLAPAAGRAGRLGMMSRLRAETREVDGTGPTDLAQALRRAGRVIRRPSLVFVISDFLAEPGWQRALRALATRHDVVAVRVSDPREGEIPQVGIVVFEDPETGRQREVDTTDARFRSRYRAAAVAQDEGLARDIRAARAQLLRISTAEPPLGQLVRFVRSRQVVRGGATAVPS